MPVSRILYPGKSRSGNHFSSPDVTIRIKQPTQQYSDKRRTALLGLAPREVYHASDCHQRSGELLPHHFTLTPISRDGIFSVALSVSDFHRNLPVKKHGVCRCSDFPSRFARSETRRLPGNPNNVKNKP